MEHRRWSWKKWVFFVFGSFALILVAAVSLMPYWFPWALKKGLASQGGTFSSFERQSYTHFLLHDVRFSKNDTRFEAKQLETLFPTALIWQKVFKTEKTSENILIVSDWAFETVKTGHNLSPSGIYEDVHTTQTILNRLRYWVPRAVFQKGVITTGQTRYVIPSAVWDQGNLEVKGELPSSFHQQCDLRVFFAPEFPWEATFALTPIQIRGQLVLDKISNTNSLDLHGSIFWRTNEAYLTAFFPEGKVVPSQADLTAEAVSVPANLLKLHKYGDIEGSFSAHWKEGEFKVNLDLLAEPREDWTTSEVFEPEALGELRAIIHASGNTNQLQIDQAELTAPWLTARLGEQVRFDFDGKMLSEFASFRLSADFAKQPWFPLTGRVKGEALLKKGSNSIPEMRFQISGERLTGHSVDIAKASAKGELIWPELEISTLDLRLARNSRVQASGIVDLKRKWVEHALIEVEEPESGHWLPKGYSYSNLRAKTTIIGPWKTPRLEGSLQVEIFTTPYLKSLALQSKWQDHNFKIELTPDDNTSLVVEGAAQLGTAEKRINLSTLDLRQNANKMELTSPVSLIFQKISREHWKAQVAGLQWRDGDRNLALDAEIAWPESGRVSGEANNLEASLVQSFFKQRLLPIVVDRMSAKGGWTNGPIHGNLKMIAQAPVTARQVPCSAEIDLSMNNSGISIKHMAVQTRDLPIASGSGFLPLTLRPEQSTESIQIVTNGALRVEISTTSNPLFWDQLTEKTPVRLQDPTAHLSLTGDLRRPEGVLEMGVRQAKINWRTNLPEVRIDSLQSQIVISNRLIRLERLNFLLEGQTISASGTVPVPAQVSDWRRILNWSNATARVDIPQAQMAAMAPLAPKAIAPKGTFSAYLTTDKGVLAGEVFIHDAATRQLGQSGALQEIQSHLKLVGDQIQIVSTSGLIDGSPVSLAGYVNWQKREPATHLPFFELFLKGEKVPLARSSDVILRSDAALLLSNIKGGAPLLSGTATLQRSYYLSDLNLLVPPKLASPKDRPPYFSIDAPTLAKWRLDVTVQGDRFLKIQSPFFNGTVSADLKLGGTLDTPIAIGNLKINSGTIQFPFGNLKVQQGEVAITSADPYNPMLFVTATTRAYSYQIRMQASGHLDNLELEFSSTPALASQQILLMLSTGELPPTQTSLSGQQRSERVALFVGKNFLTQIGLFKGDEERLTIRSGESLSQPEIDAYTVEYKLSDEWSVVGDYDPYGGINVGGKWRFFSE